MRKHDVVIFVAVVSTILLAVQGGAMSGQGESKPKQATFRITNEFEVPVPTGAKTVRLWFAVPQRDRESEIKDFRVETDYPVQYHKDSAGNEVGYIAVHGPNRNKIRVRESFTLTRSEIRGDIDPRKVRPLSDQERSALAHYLQPSTHVIIDDQIKTLAKDIVGNENNPVIKSRKIYDWVLKNIDYWVKDPDNLRASSVGSTEYCLSTKTGNCTDFHSLYASLARAADVPTRLVYGSLLKPTLNGMDVDASYHCWVQVYAPPQGWITLDVAVADIYYEPIRVTERNAKLVELTTATGYTGINKAKVDYYFGNLDERRVVWSMGRDLLLTPQQDGPPVNALPKMYVEVDGEEFKDWKRKLTYEELRT